MAAAARAIVKNSAAGSKSAAFPIGVDLGPNLSATGSLATILWLVALRREGLHISAKELLRAGVVAMPPALVLAIGALLLAS